MGTLVFYSLRKMELMGEGMVYLFRDARGLKNGRL